MSAKENLQAKLGQVAGDLAALTSAVQAEGRPMTADEDKKFQDLDAHYRELEASIANFDRLDEINARMASVPAPKVAPALPRDGAADATPVPTPGRRSVTGGDLVARNFANHGFAKGIGEYFLKVRDAKVLGKIDERLLVNTITTFGGEGVGADGGFALPPQFATQIMQAVMPEDSFLNALRPITTNSNLLVVPTDEDPPWGTGGITAAKTAEGAAITASKPVLKKVSIVMHKIAALVHLSDESLQDIPFLASYVQNKMGQHLRFKMENYVMNGTGEDEPLGIINAPGIVSVSDTASTATVIGAADVFAMKASTLPGAGAFWIVNPTVLPAIWSLKSDATAGYPLFAPDMTKAPEGMLLGLPVYRSEASPLLNTTGDILLVVPDGYILATSGGVNAATTIAFAFDQDLQSFRATLRMGGAPVLSAKVTRNSGAAYAGFLIALAGSRS